MPERFRFPGARFAAGIRDIHHANAVINPDSPYLCGTDHCCGSPFHFEVENNSLQTIPPQR
ncbi:hypothetical protein C3B80_24865 [Enterobacter cloacae]|nr:hypothetical protein C3B80_24865 [Enterobacter cloacae]